MSSRTQSLLVAVIIIHLAVDCLLPLLIHDADEEFHIFCLLGACFSQVNLIAFWPVFAPGAIVWRMPWAALLGTLMWGSLVAFNRLVPSGIARNDALIMGAAILGGTFLAQIPLWFIRLKLRYRFYPPGGVLENDRQFNLRSLLVGITLLSIALAAGQLALPPSNSTFFGPSPVEILAIFLIVATTNLLLTTPCMWLALTASLRNSLPFAVFFLAYILIVDVIEVAVISAVNGGAAGNEQVFDLLALNICQSLSIVATLVVLRAAGFTWRRAGQELPEAKSAKPLDETAPPKPPLHPLDS